MKKAVVVFSGGQDSTTCLVQALAHYDEVHAITFDYGQRHREEIDTARREVRCANGFVELTGTEYELLVMLAREPGKVFSRDDILNRLRGQEAELYTRAVDILVSRLRRKLEVDPKNPRYLQTVRGVGYMLAPD